MQCKSFSDFFNKKYWQISDINVLNFNNTLTNDVVSFEQPGPDVGSNNKVQLNDITDLRHKTFRTSASSNKTVFDFNLLDTFYTLKYDDDKQKTI